MNSHRRPVDANTPTLPDIGLMLTGPLTALRMWADVNRVTSSMMPAALLIATSPFFWAPPLWVGALMAAQASQPSGGPHGSTATPREAARAPARTLDPPPRPARPAAAKAPPVKAPPVKAPPVKATPAPRRRRAADA